MGASSSIASAVYWVEAILFGSVSTVVAVIAVAWFGFLMMAGRVEWRRGVRIILGCFLLFGAPVIAAGILRAAGPGTEAVQPVSAPAATALPNEPSQQPGTICWTCGAD